MSDFSHFSDKKTVINNKKFIKSGNGFEYSFLKKYYRIFLFLFFAGGLIAVFINPLLGGYIIIISMLLLLLGNLIGFAIQLCKDDKNIGQLCVGFCKIVLFGGMTIFLATQFFRD